MIPGLRVGRYRIHSRHADKKSGQYGDTETFDTREEAEKYA